MPYGRSGQMPKAIDLTPAESALAAKVSFHPDLSDDRDRFLESAAAAVKLTKFLLKRKVIPQHRLDYFSDPQYNIGTKMSHQEVFESHGTRGDEILEHENFLKYLYYFVYGADLPKPVIDAFCKIVTEDRGTSGMVMDQMHRYVRKEIRDRKLNRWQAAEEFYKLVLDCGLYVDNAKGSARRRSRQSRGNARRCCRGCGEFGRYSRHCFLKLNAPATIERGTFGFGGKDGQRPPPLAVVVSST